MESIEIKAAAIIEAGVEAIEKHGWVQQWAGNERVGFCAIGSLDGRRYGVLNMACKALDRVARERQGFPFGVIDYNDEPGRTKEEVIDLMKHAAKNLRNEAPPS